MKIFFRKMGEGMPLIILHGLYGSSDNWVSIGKELANYFEVFLVDMRNHGRSEKSEEFNYFVIAEDIKDFMQEQNIKKAIILGHSMGGKAAMFFAAKNPEKIVRLIIADISPLSYSKYEKKFAKHEKILSVLNSIDLSKITNRKEAEELLNQKITDVKLQKFLAKNIFRNKDKTFSWRINITVLRRELHSIMQGFDSFEEFKNLKISNYPVLFLKGENSSYIKEKDEKYIKQIFEFVEIQTIKNAGHWLHSEQTNDFLNKIKKNILS